MCRSALPSLERKAENKQAPFFFFKMLLFPGCLHIHFGFFSSAHILVNHFVFVSLGYYITKHRKLGGLVRNLFLSRFLEARKSKIKASADSMVRAHFLDSDFGFVVTL